MNHKPGHRIRMRMGMASGPSVGGVVGEKRPHYSVFGDTVNMAAAMEETGEPMRIQVRGRRVVVMMVMMMVLVMVIMMMVLVMVPVMIIQMTETSAEILEDDGGFRMEPRKREPALGRGEVNTCWLIGRTGASSD